MRPAGQLVIVTGMKHIITYNDENCASVNKDNVSDTVCMVISESKTRMRDMVMLLTTHGYAAWIESEWINTLV